MAIHEYIDESQLFRIDHFLCKMGTEPMLESPPPVQSYAPDSWRPGAADALVARFGGWHGARVEP